MDYKAPSLKTKLFGHTYDAPFGISPVGLQGLMWPKSPEILAKAAFDHNIPFVLTLFRNPILLIVLNTLYATLVCSIPPPKVEP